MAPWHEFIPPNTLAWTVLRQYCRNTVSNTVVLRQYRFGTPAERGCGEAPGEMGVGEAVAVPRNSDPDHVPTNRVAFSRNSHAYCLEMLLETQRSWRQYVDNTHFLQMLCMMFLMIFIPVAVQSMHDMKPRVPLLSEIVLS